jgi:hypothetical protein
LHARQAAPFVPQVAVEGVVQVDPWQHPLAQDVASQMHWPPEQR